MTAVLRQRILSVRGEDRHECDPLVGRGRDYQAFDAYAQACKRERDHDGLQQVQASLVARANEPFDAHRPSHLHALTELWTQAFPELPFPEARCSPRWSELGFQGKDPVIDLRGAGYLGLRHLTQSLIANGASFHQGAAAGFPLALASLSCTAMLCGYFGLNRSLIFPGSGSHQARPELVRCLLELQARSSMDVLQILHTRLLRHLAATWSRMQGPATTIMDFNLALRSTFTHLHKTLEATPRPWDLITVAGRLEEARELWPWEAPTADPTCLCAPTMLAFLWLLAVRLRLAGEGGPGALAAAGRR